MRCPARSQAAMSWPPALLSTRLPHTKSIDLRFLLASVPSMRSLISCHVRLAPPSVVGSSKVKAISGDRTYATAREMPASIAVMAASRRNSRRFMDSFSAGIAAWTKRCGLPCRSFDIGMAEIVSLEQQGFVLFFR